MHSIPGVVVVASLAFLGTMFDNFFAFAAQLVITDRRRYRRKTRTPVQGHIPFLVVLITRRNSITNNPQWKSIRLRGQRICFEAEDIFRNG